MTAFPSAAWPGVAPLACSPSHWRHRDDFGSAPVHAAELPVLTAGHTDVGVNYEDGAWDLHVHAEDLGEEYEPDAVWLQVGSAP